MGKHQIVTTGCLLLYMTVNLFNPFSHFNFYKCITLIDTFKVMQCLLTSHWLLLCVHTAAISLGNSVVDLEKVQCQLNDNNASNLIITLVVGSQCAPSLDVFIAIMKLANALLHQGNTRVQV